MVTNTILTKQPDFQNLPRFVYTPSDDIRDCIFVFLDGGACVWVYKVVAGLHFSDCVFIIYKPLPKALYTFLL